MLSDSAADEHIRLMLAHKPSAMLVFRPKKRLENIFHIFLCRFLKECQKLHRVVYIIFILYLFEPPIQLNCIIKNIDFPRNGFIKTKFVKNVI